MPGKIVNDKSITLAETRMLLDQKGKDQLDQFQLRTYEYVNHFVKLDEKKAEELVGLLIHRFSLERDEAIQIANCMPGSTEELQVFFSAGRHRVLLSSQLQEILNALKEYRLE